MRLLAFACCLVAGGSAVAAEIVVKPQEKPLLPSNMDVSVKPWDDFYEYANGGWLKNNPIPPEYSSWGAFTELHEINNAKLHKILETAAADKDAKPGSPAQMVGDFYASGMDEVAIDAAGASAIQPELDRIAALKTPADLAAEFGHLLEIGVDPGFFFGAEQDAKNSESMIADLWQAGLGLPEREYYLEDTDDAKKLRDQYVAHVKKMFMLLGDSDEAAAANAAAVLDFETKLAAASMWNVALRDPEMTYHKMTQDEARQLMPNLDWDAFYKAIGIAPPPEVNVGQPDFFTAFDKLIKDTPIDVWKTYLRWHLVHDSASYLSKDFVDASFDFYGKTLQGSEELRPRWKRVMGTIDASIGEALGQLYVKDNFPPEAKQQALKLVENLRSALKDSIENLTWMGPETKKAALAKLAAVAVKIGYPDKWRDYSGLKIDRGAYVGNVFRANAFEFHRDLAKIGKPVDRTEWGMSPPTVNAYYNPGFNEIVFPAGILQPPFFDPNADDAVNYGGIGAVIGHELTHGFDDQGRKYDAKGNMKNWWTAADLKNFKSRAEAIIEQFGAYEPVKGHKINGKLTTGENIADLGGIKIAHAALEKALAEKPAPEKIDGFTPDQRFYLSYAQVWRNNERDESVILQLKTDPHSPTEFRVIGPLSNLPEFGKTFGFPEDNSMMRAAKDRVEIW